MRAAHMPHQNTHEPVCALVLHGRVSVSHERFDTLLWRQLTPSTEPRRGGQAERAALAPRMCAARENVPRHESVALYTEIL